MSKIPQIPNQHKAQAARPQVQVDLTQCNDITCDKCNNYTFDQVVVLKRLSEILSPTGKSEIIPIQVLSCRSCGHVNSEFLPPQLRKAAEETALENTTPNAQNIVSTPLITKI